MSLFRRFQRWLEDPYRSDLESVRIELAVERAERQMAQHKLVAAESFIAELRQHSNDTLRLVAEMKRAGFVSEPTLNQPRLAPVEESEEERELWAAIYQRAPRGSQVASMLWQHAQAMLAADEPMEHVIGSILEGGEIDMDDLEERGA